MSATVTASAVRTLTRPRRLKWRPRKIATRLFQNGIARSYLSRPGVAIIRGICGALRYGVTLPNRRERTVDNVRGAGVALFAAVFLLIGGVLDIIYGIAAIGNANFFAHNAQYMFANLNAWGWINLIIGIIQVLAGMSLFGGGIFGRVFGIFAGSLAAIVALLSIPAYPLWSIAIFALSLWIIYGLSVYGEERPGQGV